MFSLLSLLYLQQDVYGEDEEVLHQIKQQDEVPEEQKVQKNTRSINSQHSIREI